MAGIEDWYESNANPLGDSQLGEAPTLGAEQGASVDMPTQDFQDWATGAQGEKRLATSIRQASQKNPDQMADVYRLQGKTGLPAQLIERNYDLVRRQAEQDDFDARKFRQDFPKLSGLMEQQENAEIAHDDLQALQVLERTLTREQFEEMGPIEWLVNAPAAAYKQGQLGEERNQLAFQQLMGDDSPELDSRITDMEGKLGNDFSGDSWIGTAISSASEFLPQTLSSLREGAVTGLTGATAAAGTVALAGQLGPQVALPEEIITVPGAAAAGFAAGSRTGAAQYSFRQEAGAAYREFVGFRDDEGNPLDQNTAKIAAVVSGGINAGLELFGLETLVKSFPGGKKALAGVSRQSVKEALRQPTVRRALADLGKNFAGTWTVETMTEVMQEGVTILAGELAKSVDAGNFEGMTGEQVQERLTETFTQAASGMAILSAPGPLTNFAMDYGRVRKAQRNQQVMEAIGEGSSSSKVRERLPQKFQDIVAKLKDGGAVENVQVPVEKWDELFQSAGVDPEVMSNEVTGSYKAYTEAKATGGDIVIPIEAYARHLAATEFHGQLTDNARFRPGEMTPAEARDWQANESDMVQNFVDSVRDEPADASQAIFDDVMGQLQSAGRTTATAEREAKLTQSVFRSLGSRMGVDPVDLYRQYNISINRPLPDILKTQGGDFDPSVDPVLDRLRAGDIPSQSDAFGQSLLEFMRERGVQDPGGDLASRDVDRNLRPFERRAIRDEGVTLDNMAREAVLSGYMPGFDPDTVTQNDLLEFVERELQGEPVFPVEGGSQQLREARQAMLDLQEYLDNIGIDLSQMDNPAIRAMLAGRQRDPEQPRPDDGVTLEQQTAQMQVEEGSFEEFQRLIERARGERGQRQADQESARTIGGGQAADGWRDATSIRGSDGQPAVLYRGAARSLTPDDFARDAIGQATQNPSAHLGVWFTSDAQDAARYGRPSDFYADVRNPRVYETQDVPEFNSPEDALALREQLQSEGHDGIVFDYSGEGGPIHVVAFEPDQVIEPETVSLSQSAINELPDRLDIIRAFKGFDGDSPIRIIQLVTGLTEKHDALYRMSDPALTMLDDDVNQSLSEVIIENGASKPLFAYGEKPEKMLMVWDDAGNVYRIIRGNVIQLSNQEQEGSDLSEAAGITSNILSRVFRDINNQNPETVERQRQEAIKRKEEMRRQRRLQEIPELSPDFDMALQELADWAEDFQEFEAALAPSLFDVSDRNRTRLGRATMALPDEQESYENAGRGDVTIYRALPEGEEIGAGDWVSFSQNYAAGHETNVEGRQAQTVEMEVPGTDVWWYGADENEWVYIPDGTWGDFQSIRNVWESLTEGKKPDRISLDQGQAPDIGAEVSALSDRIEQELGLDSLFMSYRPRQGSIVVDNIVVPRTEQGRGVGSSAMEQITQFADDRGLRIDLSPALKDDRKGTTSRARLVRFYKRFGFVENKGRNKDFAISESMYREPKTSLNQGRDRQRGPRGRITFPQSRSFFNIELLEGADLSTFIHESGHLYLEILRDLSSQEDAPQQIRDDFQSILEWMGVESGDQIQTEHHEQWARGFEAYIMEGKAPSAELRSVFARFKAWMLAIYRTVQSLNVDLTDDVRGVMDRLVATDQEISEAQDEAGYQPLFESADLAGMSADEYANYQKLAMQARQAGEDDVTRQVMTEYTRERKQWWKDQYQAVRDEVAEEVNQQPAYVAASVMGRGKLPDGSPLPEGIEQFKMSKSILVDMGYGQSLSRLPRPYIYTRQGGIHPDQAAEIFGYRSGEEMLEAIINARPRRDLIKAETDKRMNERHGNMMEDGGLGDAAEKAVHNERRAEVMAVELRKLGTRSNRRTPPSSVLSGAAERIVAEKKVRDLQPHLYLRAESKASREAFDAVARGDFEAATQAKQRQLFNHYLYREAARARQDVDKTVDLMSKYTKKPARQRVGKAGADYLEQIDGLLARYEFRRGVSLRQIDRRASLRDWMDSQNEQGFTVDVPDSVLNDARQVNYKDVPVDELRGIRDAVRQIEHLARLKNKLLASADERDFEEQVDAIVNTIDENRTRNLEPPQYTESMKKRLTDFVGDAHAWHMKPEFIFRWLDGDAEVGPVWNALFKPIADAEIAEQAMNERASERLAEIMSSYTRKERAQWHTTKHYIKATGQTMNKASIFSVALNWGNQYNREVMMEGHGWNEAQVAEILANLDGRDWALVQDIWDVIDSFWPDIEKMEKDLTGVAPQKVEPVKIVNEFGEFRGGYYPIKYDPNAAVKTARREEKAGDNLFENSYTKPATRNGHTKERTGSGGQRIRLDMDVVSEHLGQVMHDLTHRRAIVDVNRLSEDKRVREAIQETAGRKVYDQIRPWLQAVANEVLQPQSFWEKLIGRARVGATVVNMGLKVTTAIVQPLGYLNSIDMLGARYSWRGLNDFFGNRGQGDFYAPWRNMKHATEFVHERSVMMQNRQKTFDRDVRDSLRRLTKEGPLQNAQRSFFIMTGLMDMAVSVPTWLGSYKKAMEGAVPEIEAGNESRAIDYADSIVRQTQSAGGAKDLARIQRGGEVQRSFVMFYSYFSVLYNQFARKAGRIRSGQAGVAEIAASAFFLWFAPSILGELIAARGPDDDEEWAKWAAQQGILYPAGTIVGMRDVANAALTPFGYDGSPAFDAFAQTARAAAIPFKAISEDDEVTRADVKSAVLAAGYWGKLPSRQAWITGEYIYDLATGEDSPESPQDFVRDLFFSRPATER